MPRRKKTTPTTPLLQTLQELRTNIEKLKAAPTHRTKEITILLKREEMLAKVFRLIPDMIIVTELASGIIVDVNDRYCEVMGYRRDELIGSSTLDLKSWHCPEDRNVFTTLLATDTACREFKTTLCTKSGTRIPVMISARVLELENTPCIVSIVQDITELHQKEQALEYRISLERLVASVSTHFLTMRSGDLDRGIVHALEMIGTFAGADRCSVWQCMPDGSRIDATHEWYGAGLPPLLHRRTAISLNEQLPVLAQHIRKGATYALPATRSAETSPDADQSFFSAQGTAMLVAVPMRYGGQPTILVSCEKNTVSPWPGDLPALLKIAGEIFMSAMVRARNERDLRDSEQRFRSLFDNAQDGMLVVDPERLRFMTANRSFIKMLGYSTKELQTLSVKDIHPPEQVTHLVERYYTAAKGSTVRAEAVPVIRKDSTTFLADMVLSTVILDNRPYLLCVFRDMTEQLTVETERLRLFTAVEQATEFIAILGADGSFQYINPAGQQMFGYAMEEVYGKNAFATDKGIYDPAFYRAIWDELRSGKAWSGRLTYQSRDGTVREIEQNISPVKDRNGSIICFLSIGRDITNEIRLEQALRHAQKMEAIGTLSSGIAHDFNNILSVITGYAQMLLSSSAENSPEEANLVEILRAGRRARDLVRQILTFSRQTEQERQPLHIAPIIKETLRFLRASLPTSIVIEQDIATDTDIILTDPTQIHQIMMNLCTNAAHAMKERGGTLRVTVAPRELTEREAQALPELPPGHYLTLSVSDTGHGIRHDIIERIFDPYFTTKPQGEGTGLGLSVVHGIVKQHGGAIRVFSTEGHGTTFELWFPRHPDAASVAVEERQPVQGGSGRILLVDDDPAVVKMGQEMLERLGYRVIGVTNAAVAYEVFCAAPDQYDLLITDKTMREMNGFELVAAVRRIRPELPVMVLTGFSDAQDPTHVQRLGIQELVMKPILLPDIAAKIRRLLHLDAVHNPHTQPDEKNYRAS